MERPKQKDFETSSHDCWGKSEQYPDVHGYSEAQDKYIDFLEEMRAIRMNHLNSKETT